jgi:hypothetical protein
MRGIMSFPNAGFEPDWGVKTAGIFTFSGAVSSRTSSRTWTMAAADTRASSAVHPQIQVRLSECLSVLACRIDIKRNCLVFQCEKRVGMEVTNEHIFIKAIARFGSGQTLAQTYGEIKNTRGSVASFADNCKVGWEGF